MLLLSLTHIKSNRNLFQIMIKAHQSHKFCATHPFLIREVKLVAYQLCLRLVICQRLFLRCSKSWLSVRIYPKQLSIGCLSNFFFFAKLVLSQHLCQIYFCQIRLNALMSWLVASSFFKSVFLKSSIICCVVCQPWSHVKFSSA